MNNCTYAFNNCNFFQFQTNLQSLINSRQQVVERRAPDLLTPCDLQMGPNMQRPHLSGTRQFAKKREHLLIYSTSTLLP